MNEATAAAMHPFLYHQLMLHQRAVRRADRRSRIDAHRRRFLPPPPQNISNIVDSHVKDAGDKVYISMDVPGIQKKDLTVSLEDNLLTVEGTRHLFLSGGASKTQKFQKQFTLKPGMMDTSRLSANLSNGVLVVKAWKKEKREPVLINITEHPHTEEESSDVVVSDPIVDLASSPATTTTTTTTTMERNAESHQKLSSVDDDDDSAEEVVMITAST